MNHRVIVACEFSGIVREAFNAIHGAWAMSCDLEPAEDGSRDFHQQGDVRDFLLGDYGQPQNWDLMIAHPPCTYLSNSGLRWLYNNGRKSDGRNEKRWQQMRDGVAFLLELWNMPVERICIEQPRNHTHADALIGIPVTQRIQPWMFGHWETKETCLRLKNLPLLKVKYQTIDECREALGLPTGAMPVPRVHHATPGPDRWKERSRTLPYIAEAYTQWAA